MCIRDRQQVVTEDRLRDLYGLDFEITHGARGRLCNYFNPSGELT